MILYSKNLLMDQKDEIDADKILPVEWGTLKSFGVSAVPADDVSGDYAKKCFTFVTDKGAFSIITQMSVINPTIDDIKSATFFSGDYSTDYNGAVFINNLWNPAVSKDLSDRIAYYINNVVKRNIRFTTLAMWNWRNGYKSTKIDGYTYKIDNSNTLLIYYNNNLVLKIK